MKPHIRLRRTGNPEQFSGHSKRFELRGIPYERQKEISLSYNSLILKNVSVNSVVNFLTLPPWLTGEDHETQG